MAFPDVRALLGGHASISGCYWWGCTGSRIWMETVGTPAVSAHWVTVSGGMNGGYTAHIPRRGEGQGDMAVVPRFLAHSQA